MSKRVFFLLLCLALFLAGGMYSFTSPAVFSCESQFSVVQNINGKSVHAEGLIFINMANDHILMNIDGLLSHDNKNQIISRTLKIKYKKFNPSAHLYQVTSVRTLRDTTDNIDDTVAINLLFGKGPDDKIIYLNQFNNNTLLFGNHTFPQYGCKRK
ncbi:TPA: hypothetical protein ACOEME_001338 [Enterobacter cloacae subsp. dissolvens]